MRILLIGATGTIGGPLYNTLAKKNEIIPAYRNSEAYAIDITNKESIEDFLKNQQPFDAIINAAGHAVWKPFTELNEADYYEGIRSKLMGQVNLVHIAQKYLKDNGRIILTTGILAEKYEPNAVSLSLVNGAIHSFVMAAAHELPKNILLQVVAPGAIEGNFPSDKKFSGYYPVAIEKVIETYEKALNTETSGNLFKIYE
ncbi:short chain dehydrogenase [Flavobacteriaceae bacterium M23B6Z8]